MLLFGNKIKAHILYHCQPKYDAKVSTISINLLFMLDHAIQANCMKLDETMAMHHMNQTCNDNKRYNCNFRLIQIKVDDKQEKFKLNNRKKWFFELL